MSESVASAPAVAAAGDLRAGSRRVRRRGFVLSIRWIVTGTAIVLTAGAVLSVNAVAERNARRALAREVEGRLLLETRNLALASSEAFLTEFPELVLHPLLKEIKARHPEIEFALVLDRTGTIQGDPDARQLGSKYHASEDLVALEARDPLAPGEGLFGDKHVLVATVPVLHRGGSKLGTAIVALKRSYLESLLAEARRQQTLVMAAFLVVGILAAYVMMSLLLRPVQVLREGIERIGSGDLDTPVGLRDRTELGLLADALDEMAGQVKRAQVEMVERERLSHEVELARQIQRALLPSRSQTIGDFRIEGNQQPAAEVGGDYYDFFPLSGDRFGIAVADVSGKGLAGCLVMSMLHALLRAFRNTHTSPAELLSSLDEHLSESLQTGSFVTIFYAIIDVRSGVMTYASAGHSPTLLFRASTGQSEWLRTRGIPLGAIRGGVVRRSLQDAQVTLELGDALVQYTDGITEAFDPQGEQFGMDRVEEAVRWAAPHGGSRVLQALRRSVADWTGGGTPDDDETVLVVSREGPAFSDRGEEPAKVAIDPLACLAEAKLLGRRLKLGPTLESLVAIDDWLRSLPLEREVQEQMEVVSTAVYEACANVIEHGLDLRPDGEVELWWVPGPTRPEGKDPRRYQAREESADPRDVLREGYFLIRDQGRPFRADNRKDTDFTDPSVWRRGRGLGLDIIHRAMHHVSYHPSTPMGNVMLMAYVPKSAEEEERRRA